MMQLTINDNKKASKFNTIFAHLKAFTDNVCLFYKEDGVYIQCMDDSRCCLFECVLDKSWFNEYKIDEPCSSGINIALFQKILGARQESQWLTLRLNSGDGEGEETADKLCIDFYYEKKAVCSSSSTTTTFDKFFEVPLYSIESDVMEITDFETAVDLTMDSKLFYDLVNQLTMFDDNITFTFFNDTVHMLSSGLNGSMKAVIKVEDVVAYAFVDEGESDLKQSYSLRFIQMMAHFNKLAPEMLLGFSKTMPMFMRYNVDTDVGAVKESYVRIHLAPKILD